MMKRMLCLLAGAGRISGLGGGGGGGGDGDGEDLNEDEDPQSRTLTTMESSPPQAPPTLRHPRVQPLVSLHQPEVGHHDM